MVAIGLHEIKTCDLVTIAVQQTTPIFSDLKQQPFYYISHILWVRNLGRTWLFFWTLWCQLRLLSWWMDQSGASKMVSLMSGVWAGVEYVVHYGGGFKPQLQILWYSFHQDVGPMSLHLCSLLNVGRSDTMWLLKLGHKRLYSFRLTGWTTLLKPWAAM